ncbi:MAG: archaetidylserine decarboxylase [Xanthobacteraceae bacterium]
MLRIFDQEDINFLLTNRIPRRLATQFIGWFSQIEQPFVRDASIALWKLFSDLDLSEAKRSEFKSLHDCFIRELKDGARPVDSATAILTSPCDAIVGAHGAIAGTELFQAKGFPYTLQDLLPDPALVEAHRNGRYVTLRLKSSMYHRFHAPYDGCIDKVIYVSGDTWNVNPIALQRIERLFCKNERAVIKTTLAPGGQTVTLVAVAAILVASIRLHCVDGLLNHDYRGRTVIACDSAFKKGDELGWFQHGSTIIVFAPDGFEFCDNVREGAAIQMGQPLLRLP